MMAMAQLAGRNSLRDIVENHGCISPLSLSSWRHKAITFYNLPRINEVKSYASYGALFVASAKSLRRMLFVRMDNIKSMTRL